MSVLRKALAGSAGLVLLAAGSAHAATSAGITLSGVVQAFLNITVTPTASASSLDLTAAVTNLKVATVKAESNNLAGYGITVSSANRLASQCTGANGPCFYSPVAGGSNLGFTLVRDAVNVSFSGASGTFVTKSSRSIVGGDLYDAKVTYDGSSANLPQASNYNETLTFAISNQ